MNEPSIRVGADIGGTFTDLVMIDATGRVVRKKVASTVDDYSRGILSALEQSLSEHMAPPKEIAELVHGTTVATNAVLELKGAKVGLITTKGFRDVLEIRRLRMPRLYLLDWRKPPVLVERFLRREVTERLAADGTVLTKLDEAEVESVGRWLVNQGVEALAVVFLNSYRNPLHEIAAGRVLRRLFPQIPVSLSVEILPEMQEYERTSTTVVNAYVQPPVQSYLRSLRSTLSRGRIDAPLLIMQSNGGIISAKSAGNYPVRIIESGPAAGVIACQRLAELAGYSNVISFDMGGTTAKASIIENGRIHQATEYEVGGGVSASSRLNQGGGYVIRVASIDIAEVGAGGGSLVSFDKAGGVQVGPQSAGASPGPVCYRNGNSVPTVTDANIVLGYINPVALAGGSLPIDASASAAAIEEQVSRRLDCTAAEAAFGIHTIANANMIRALRSVTIERGRDPGEFALCAFGGSGPIHAATIARAMEIKRVIVPPSPGLFSAFGLLLANIEHHYSRTERAPLMEVPPRELEKAFRNMEDEARRNAEDPDFPIKDYSIHRSMDLRYIGQTMSLSIPAPEGAMRPATLVELRDRFYGEYLRTYGFHSPGETLELVTLRVVAKAGRGLIASWLEEAARAESEITIGQRTRRAYFGAELGTHDVAVVTRSELGVERRRGPIIVEAYDSTTVIPPDCWFHRDRVGNIIIDLSE